MPDSDFILHPASVPYNGFVTHDEGALLRFTQDEMTYLLAFLSGKADHIDASECDKLAEKIEAYYKRIGF